MFKAYQFVGKENSELAPCILLPVPACRNTPIRVLQLKCGGIAGIQSLGIKEGMRVSEFEKDCIPMLCHAAKHFPQPGSHYSTVVKASDRGPQNRYLVSQALRLYTFPPTQRVAGIPRVPFGDSESTKWSQVQRVRSS